MTDQEYSEEWDLECLVDLCEVMLGVLEDGMPGVADPLWRVLCSEARIASWRERFECRRPSDVEMAE